MVVSDRVAYSGSVYHLVSTSSFGVGGHVDNLAYCEFMCPEISSYEMGFSLSEYRLLGWTKLVK